MCDYIAPNGLQRSRARESAEWSLELLASVTLAWLQRSRARESAEWAQAEVYRT